MQSGCGFSGSPRYCSPFHPVLILCDWLASRLHYRNGTLNVSRWCEILCEMNFLSQHVQLTKTWDRHQSILIIYLSGLVYAVTKINVNLFYNIIAILTASMCTKNDLFSHNLIATDKRACMTAEPCENMRSSGQSISSHASLTHTRLTASVSLHHSNLPSWEQRVLSNVTHTTL